jgi:molybdopterin biosynthesis enzyme
LAEELRNSGERREFVRVFVDGEGRARLSGAQASHLLLSLANANALVEVPPRSTLAEGTILPIVYL